MEMRETREHTVILVQLILHLIRCRDSAARDGRRREMDDDWRTESE